MAMTHLEKLNTGNRMDAKSRIEEKEEKRGFHQKIEQIKN